MRFDITVRYANGAERVFPSHHASIQDAQTLAAFLAGKGGSWTVTDGRTVVGYGVASVRQAVNGGAL